MADPMTPREQQQPPLHAAHLTVEPYARQALADGRYREAIKHFRTLAQTEPEVVWAEGLADAYRGRALELTAKGMPREALAIWENREWRCPGALPEPEQISLLLELGEIDTAQSAYARLREAGACEALSRARPHLAAYALVHPDSLRTLDPEDPVRADGETAQAALAAYCAGEDETAAGYLRAIPYRSPYRDWVTVLKALMSDPGQERAVERLLAGMDENSPFAPLADAVRLARLAEPELLPALTTVSEPVRRFATALRGWSAQRYRLWRELFSPEAPEQATDPVTVLADWREDLGEDWSRQQRLRYALHHPAVHAPEDADEFERALLQAWRTEAFHADDPGAILAAWQGVIEALRGAAEPTPGDRAALRIAAIQRHLVSDLHLLDTPLAAEAENALAESVALDPDHLPGHRLLIQRHRECGRPIQARRAMDQALARWPEDLGLLQEALEIALDGEDFEGAAVYAGRLLERDPINRRARAVLHEALLTRARSACTEDDPEAARAALDQADAWAESAPARAQLERLRAVVDASHGNGAEARRLRDRATAEGDTLGSALALAVEAERAGQPAETVLTRSGLTPPKRIERPALLELAQRMHEVAATTDDVPERALAPFAPTLRRAVRIKTLSLDDYAAVCEALRAVGQDELRDRFAREALRHRLEDPLFTVHSLEARYRQDGGGRPTSRELDQLRRAFRQARRDDDKRTAHRAGELIKRLVPHPESGA
ncbi:hypothetical protein [Halorhodospira halophila]|uniref:hypothetical protein n=1 Tax=Halorhodospira halophila TaxID=1053 RepID=UPI0011981E3A|nr:hypothetical protein [Halorhodospira halophila]